LTPEQTEAPVRPKNKAPVIDPKAVYSLEQARSTLQLAKNCLPREIRLGRLRVAKRAGKYFILGAWLLEWIEAGELPAREPRRAKGQASGANDKCSSGKGEQW
jgi:hypothetical protein